MSHAPYFSVIVPLYNKENEIAKTIQSILNQTFTDFELIVVNDGSTDKGADIVRSFEDKRIQLINQKNQGVSAARNTGIKTASANLIALLDGDDEWHPDFLETIVRLYQKYPNAGIYSTAYERHVVNASKPSPVKGLPENFEGYIENYFRIYVESGYPPFCTSCVVLLREAVTHVGMFRVNARISEDLELWMKIAYSYPVVFTSEVHSRINVVTETKASLNFHPIDVLPPVAFLESRPKKELMQRGDYEDICLAVEYMKLITAYWNLGAGSYQYARELLHNSHSRRFFVKRNGLLVLSYLPKIFTDWVLKVYTRYATMF